MMKRALLAMLRIVGLEDRLRDAFWRVRLRRATVDIRVRNVTRRFCAIDQRIRGRLLRLSDERAQLEEFLDNIKRGDVVWDVGANVGLYAIFASHFAGTDGTVCAFEPEPTTLDRLKDNCVLNAAGNILTVATALSDESGEAVIYSSATHPGGATLRQTEDMNQGTRIKLDTAERLVSSGAVPPPNILKVDVEGAEYGVLAGMRSLLASERCRFVLLEVHPNKLVSFGHSAEQVRAVLEEAGFTVRGEAHRGSEVLWSACKSAF